MTCFSHALRRLGWRCAAAVLLVPFPALAADPQNYQLGLSEPVSPLAVAQAAFHDNLLMPILTGIVLLVLLLLVYVSWRFSARRNPNPSKTTHNTLLEIAWTAAPVLILLVILFPSLRVLYQSADVSNPEMTVKVTGHQWYWSYAYPDHEGIEFDSMLMARTEEEAREMNVRRLMDVDNPLVVPTGTRIRMLFTSADVLHNWAVSEFGIRMDTVPGRLNEQMLIIPEGREGQYYGFCSELCGVDHSFMPISVRAVTRAAFDSWVQSGGQTAVAGVPQPDVPALPQSGETVAVLAD